MWTSHVQGPEPAGISFAFAFIGIACASRWLYSEHLLRVILSVPILDVEWRTMGDVKTSLKFRAEHSWIEIDNFGRDNRFSVACLGHQIVIMMFLIQFGCWMGLILLWGLPCDRLTTNIRKRPSMKLRWMKWISNSMSIESCSGANWMRRFKEMAEKNYFCASSCVRRVSLSNEKSLDLNGMAYTLCHMQMIT